MQEIIAILFNVLLILLLLGGVIILIFGLVNIYHIFIDVPNGKTNRIYAIKLWWMVVSGEEKFKEMYKKVKNPETGEDEFVLFFSDFFINEWEAQNKIAQNNTRKL